jgi:hypothetical protein
VTPAPLGGFIFRDDLHSLVGERQR